MSLITDFEQCLARHQILQSPRTLTVAYSGGVDSQVLLALAHQISQSYPQLNVNAIHVNHGLSAFADDWQQHCEQQCAQRKIPLKIANVEVKSSARQSLEAAARKVRYQAFQTLLTTDAILLLGHHLDDQTETFLLQLKRGAGAKGLSAMAVFSGAKQNRHGIDMLRPLLGQARSAIQDYALAQQLTWVNDESNHDTRFDRNFLRQQVLPVLNQRWPGFTQSVSRSARLLSEQQTLIEQTANEYLQLCQGDTPTRHWYTRSQEFVLNITTLLSYSIPWQKQIVRLGLQQIAAKHLSAQDGSATQPILPSEARLNELLQQLVYARDDADIVVTFGAWQCRRFQQQLFMLHRSDLNNQANLVTSKGKSMSVPIFWQGETQLSLPAGDTFWFHRLSDEINTCESGCGITVSLPLPSDNAIQIVFGGLTRRFQPAGTSHSKPLKQWFKLWQVPPWHRQRIPLLLLNDRVVAVGSEFIAQEIVHTASAKQHTKIVLHWC